MVPLLISISMCLINTFAEPTNPALVDSLPSFAFSASSFFNSVVTPTQARYSFPVDSNHAWHATQSDRDNEPKPWLQIDLGQCYTITDVGTKGRFDMNQWAITYKLSYSTHDPYSLTEYETNVAGNIITGNTDRDTEVLGVDSTAGGQPFTARYVRFTPQTYEAWPSMRVELYGTADPQCSTPCECSDGTMGVQITYETDCKDIAPASDDIFCDVITCTLTQCQCSEDTCSTNPTAIPTMFPTKNPTQATSNPTRSPTRDDDSSDELVKRLMR